MCSGIMPSYQKPKVYTEQHFFDAVGKLVKSVEPAPDADEGLLITFDDGTSICIGYSGLEGTTEYRKATV